MTTHEAVRDQLRVLQPRDLDDYYKKRELVPDAMLGELGRAEIVITNELQHRELIPPPGSRK